MSGLDSSGSEFLVNSAHMPERVDFLVWLQVDLITYSWAENRYSIETTEYFQCLHGELKTNIFIQSDKNISEIENLQHHCIDFSRGKPVFVRGTYLMVIANTFGSHRYCSQADQLRVPSRWVISKAR
jgi:hypothetical protein